MTCRQYYGHISNASIIVEGTYGLPERFQFDMEWHSSSMEVLFLLAKMPLRGEFGCIRIDDLSSPSRDRR